MENVYKTIEITGSSTESSDAAVRAAVSKASATVKHLDWFKVTEVRGHVDDGQVAHFQVTVKIGFRLE